MTDDDLLAALDLGVPPMRPSFRSDLVSLIETDGVGPDALDAPVLQIVDDERPTHRRRRWLVPAVAAAAVMAILGTWVLVTTPDDREPVASVPDLTATTATPETTATPATTPPTTTGSGRSTVSSPPC